MLSEVLVATMDVLRDDSVQAQDALLEQTGVPIPPPTTDILNPNKHYPMLMPKEKATDDIMKALKRKKRVYAFDWRFRIATFFGELIPHGIRERITWIKN